MGGGNSDGYTRNEHSKEVFKAYQKKSEIQKTFEAYVAQARKYNYVIYTNSESYKNRLLKYYPDVKVELVNLDSLMKDMNLPKVTTDELSKYYPYPKEGEYFGFYGPD